MAQTDPDTASCGEPAAAGGNTGGARSQTASCGLGCAARQGAALVSVACRWGAGLVLRAPDALTTWGGGELSAARSALRAGAGPHTAPGTDPGLPFGQTERGARGNSASSASASGQLCDQTSKRQTPHGKPVSSVGKRSASLVPEREKPPIRATLWQCRWAPPLSGHTQGSRSDPFQRLSDRSPFLLLEDTWGQVLPEPCPQLCRQRVPQERARVAQGQGLAGAPRLAPAPRLPGPARGSGDVPGSPCSTISAWSFPRAAWSPLGLKSVKGVSKSRNVTC